MLSIFDIYKIGIDPSSSDTNGPIAGYQFTLLIDKILPSVNEIRVDLFGYFALTSERIIPTKQYC
ncbi:MAG: hypothetical protein ACJAZP_002140 [Psychromonas sp.]|jgi:hypothetical protein|uniref:serine dehydratase beta chain n=1 Tax=Psychromonas sp. TaxID=1884585 RepID=UPI0039E64579